VKVLKHYSVVFPAGCFKRAVLENGILIFGNPVHLLHIRKSELSCPNAFLILVCIPFQWEVIRNQINEYIIVF